MLTGERCILFLLVDGAQVALLYQCTLPFIAIYVEVAIMANK
jgi:hypothetical protein